MASTSNNVDYSFSNDDKIMIHDQNSLSIPNEESNINKSTILEINNATTVDLTKENCNNSQCSVNKNTPQEKDSVPVAETITKLENILKDLKTHRDTSPEHKRIVREVSQKRSRKQTRKYTSSPKRFDSSSESSASLLDRSPLPKRTKKETTRKKYDSDYSIPSKEERYKFRERSPSTSSTDRSYSCVSKKLKKELSNFLGNSFVSINSKKNKNSRNPRRERSYGRSRSSRSESHDRSRYSRRDSYDKSRYSKRDDAYDKYTKKKSTRKHADRYDNYNRNYQQNDIEERYSRYYAVMYAFSIIMDILRQDDIYSTF